MPSIKISLPNQFIPSFIFDYYFYCFVGYERKRPIQQYPISKITYKPTKKIGINALIVSTIGYKVFHLAVTANIGEYVNEVLYTLNKN